MMSKKVYIYDPFNPNSFGEIFSSLAHPWSASSALTA